MPSEQPSLHTASALHALLHTTLQTTLKTQVQDSFSSSLSCQRYTTSFCSQFRTASPPSNSVLCAEALQIVFQILTTTIEGTCAGLWPLFRSTYNPDLSLHHLSHSRKFLHPKWRNSDISLPHQLLDYSTDLIAVPRTLNSISLPIDQQTSTNHFILKQSIQYLFRLVSNQFVIILQPLNRFHQSHYIWPPRHLALSFLLQLFEEGRYEGGWKSFSLIFDKSTYYNFFCRVAWA